MTMSDQQPTPPATPDPQSQPADQGSVSVEGFVRIYDPNTQRVYLETRA